MQEEERRLKIIAKQSYEEELSKEEKNVVRKRWSFGLSALGLFCSTTAFILSAISGNFLLMVANFMSGSLNKSNLKFNLERYKEALERRTNLKEQISQIEAELNAIEKEDVNIKSYADAYALFASQHEMHEQPTLNVPTINIPSNEKDYSSSNIPTLEFPTEEKSRGRM